MIKQYSCAPLPFVGQKRMFAAEFRRTLRQFDDHAVFVDLFGGSGLLSHITKREKTDATVIYNDYDNYRQRLDNIPRTNALLADLRPMLADCPRTKILPAKEQDAVRERIAREERSGFVDYITLSSSLLFSMNYAITFEALCRQTLYNNVRTTDYNADDYLDGLIVESCDYREIFQKYRDVPNVVSLVDPPYLSTDVGTYRMTWRMADYLDVLTILCGASFVYFTSDKSQILELCAWMERNPAAGNPFAECQKRTFNARMNHNSTYTDIMLYKKE